MTALSSRLSKGGTATGFTLALLVAIDAGEGTVLLLFQKGTASSVALPGGLAKCLHSHDFADSFSNEGRPGGCPISMTRGKR